MVGEGPFSVLALAVVDRLPMALISVGAWRTDATWPPAIARRARPQPAARSGPVSGEGDDVDADGDGVGIGEALWFEVGHAGFLAENGQPSASAQNRPSAESSRAARIKEPPAFACRRKVRPATADPRSSHPCIHHKLSPAVGQDRESVRYEPAGG